MLEKERHIELITNLKFVMSRAFNQTSSSGTACMGNAYARSLAPWAILSISGYDDTTSPHQTFYGMIYACDTHSCLCYFTFITIPSFVYPKLACTELLISLHNGRHLFADGFVTVRPIAMKFEWDKENVSCLKFRKLHLNPTNFNRKLTMMFKLDLKKVTLTAITPVQKGLMQKVNIFCTENEHLHAFYAPTNNRTNWMRASCWFLFLKKIGLTYTHTKAGFEIVTHRGLRKMVDILQMTFSYAFSSMKIVAFWVIEVCSIHHKPVLLGAMAIYYLD